MVAEAITQSSSMQIFFVLLLIRSSSLVRLDVTHGRMVSFFICIVSTKFESNLLPFCKVDDICEVFFNEFITKLFSFNRDVVLLMLSMLLFFLKLDLIKFRGKCGRCNVAEGCAGIM